VRVEPRQQGSVGWQGPGGRCDRILKEDSLLS
jgi:hypothetical protein